MIDGMGRNIEYLRVSVTDKCNLRCKYCMPPEGVKQIPHGELLSLEELSRVIIIMAGLGIKGVRFTGGEPLVRKNLAKLIQDIHDNPAGKLCGSHGTENRDVNECGAENRDAKGREAENYESVMDAKGIREIALTTNGVLLEEQLPALAAAGVTAVNISLDTLNPETFREITGSDACAKVLSAVECAVSSGLRTKINCVPCREWNQEELVELAGLAKRLPVDVRFIELMPLGCGKQFHGIPTAEVLDRLQERYGFARPLGAEDRRGNGPAHYYEFDDFCGKIGFISPLSHKFCGECNRIRLMADGRLKLCLHYNTGLELKPLLRTGKTDEEIRAAILRAVAEKPKAHDFEHAAWEEDQITSEKSKMVQIGG